MSELWYPGRPPFCSKDVISFLGQYVEELLGLIADEDGTHLCALESIADAALTTIDAEREECLGTDENLHNLFALFMDSTRGAILFYKAKAWDQVYELATMLTVVRNQLINTLERTSDDSAISPNSHGTTRDGSDNTASAEQEDTPGTSKKHQHQGKSALPEGTEEAQT